MTSAKDPIHAGKRRFLRNAAASTAGLTALSMFPPAIRRARTCASQNKAMIAKAIAKLGAPASAASNW